MNKRQFFANLAYSLGDKEDISKEDIINFIQSELGNEFGHKDLQKVLYEYMNDVDAIENVISVIGGNGKEVISSETTYIYDNPGIGTVERRELQLSRLDDGRVGDLVKQQCDNNHHLSSYSPLYRCCKKSCNKILCDSCDTVKKKNGEVYCREHTILYKLKKFSWDL